jgi:hypothetical protein
MKFSQNPWTEVHGYPHHLARRGFLAVALFLGPLIARAQLELIPAYESQHVFAGDAKLIHTTWRNASDKSFEAGVTARLFQASSATAMRIGDQHWKQLQLLPQQTVLETARLNFPEVKTQTRFLIQWITGTNKVLGTTTVWVHPIGLLKALKALAGEGPVGVFDPLNQIKPLLKAVAVEFEDLENSGLEQFAGKLAVVGPFESEKQIPEELGGRIHKLAEKGAAVVWIRPVQEACRPLTPSYYTLPIGKGAIVTILPALVANLSENPQSQLTLIGLCRCALHRELMIPSTNQP